MINPETSTGKRMRDSARKNDSLIDCTMGRKTRSMILTDSQYIFLSCIRPEALLQRVDNRKEENISKHV